MIDEISRELAAETSESSRTASRLPKGEREKLEAKVASLESLRQRVAQAFQKLQEREGAKQLLLEETKKVVSSESALTNLKKAIESLNVHLDDSKFQEAVEALKQKVEKQAEKDVETRKQEALKLLGKILDLHVDLEKPNSARNKKSEKIEKLRQMIQAIVNAIDKVSGDDAEVQLDAVKGALADMERKLTSETEEALKRSKLNEIERASVSAEEFITSFKQSGEGYQQKLQALIQPPTSRRRVTNDA